MTYQEAQHVAAYAGAKPCRYVEPKSGQLASRQGEVTQCWIDRVEYILVAAGGGPASLASAIKEANRYA